MTSKITTTVNPLYYLTYIFCVLAEVTIKSVEKKVPVNQHDEIDGRGTCVA